SASRSLQLDLPLEAREKATQLRRTNKIENSFIIFHPGAARPEKLWGAERWASVIDYAQNNWQIQSIVTGGNSKSEQEQIGQIKTKLSQPIVDLSGQTDLLTLAALIGQARLLVTVDSAPMHLAAATQTQQAVLFRPTNPF